MKSQLDRLPNFSEEEITEEIIPISSESSRSRRTSGTEKERTGDIFSLLSEVENCFVYFISNIEATSFDGLEWPVAACLIQFGLNNEIQ